MRGSFVCFCLVGVMLRCCALASADGTTWYVGPAGADFTTIQEALNAASPGDTVVVSEGIYVENIHFGNKDIVLRSTLPLSPEVVAKTVIDGNGSGAVVSFDGSESSDCVLSGFTIRNGSSGYGGGICGKSNATHNLATIQNNIVRGNYATACGGGIAYCDGVIQNNLIVQNAAFLMGGGFFDCDGAIQNNTVVYNSGMMGGGFYECSGTFGVIQNCIVWGNLPNYEQVYGGVPPNYSCVEGWAAGGIGNITSNPLFVDEMGGDFRLSDGSQCIDGGNPDPLGLPLTDLDGNPRVINGVADMGAFEFQLPVGDIEVSPVEVVFGEVEIGASCEAVVTIANVGEGEIELAEVSVVGSEAFSITTYLERGTVVVPQGDSVEIRVAYTPSSVGMVSATVVIVSNDPDEGAVDVFLTGTGIATDFSPEEKIEDIILSLGEFLDQGTLTGEGPGKSAAGRLKAFGNMLDEVQTLILSGRYSEARQQLLEAYRRVDGRVRPPDFVSGEAADELAKMILDLIGALTEG